MTTLYITEPGVHLTVRENRLQIKQTEQLLKSLPVEKVDNIVLIGAVSFSGKCAIELFEREVPVTWISYTGKVFGRLEPTTSVNIQRQREQFRRTEDPAFSLALAKRFVTAKIRNSRVMLSRWNRGRNLESVPQTLEDIKTLELKAVDAPDIPTLMGFEGAASRAYFQTLGQIVPAEFRFTSRTRQPPRDPVNSMLSLAYTMLMYECYTAIMNKGLHPYLGFLHQIKRGHPALASDMMEEWRTIICDAIVLDLIGHKQVTADDFEEPRADSGAVYCTGNASKRLIEAFEKKLKVHNQYLTYLDYPLSFRESLQFQVGSLVKAIELNDPELYRPITIR